MASFLRNVLIAVSGGVVLWSAVELRLTSVHLFGKVIHEYDPWFNYRATEYLASNGAHDFFQWFDHMSWHPLGRPVGTTTYPGLQFLTVWIWQVLRLAGSEISLHDVSVLLPAWFGAVSTLFVGLLAFEISRSSLCGLVAALVMAALPAHLGRTMSGEYDNECVAVPMLCASLYFWCRSQRNQSSWPMAILAGLAYFGMASSWGGYIFVPNMIAFHVCLATFEGIGDSALRRSYVIFYMVGTALAVQIPVIGQSPFKSLEQVFPLIVFILFLVVEICDVALNALLFSGDRVKQFRIAAFVTAAALLGCSAVALFHSGHFSPWSVRIRSLFLHHTRTGNPLVDSVSEHRATTEKAMWMMFHLARFWAVAGWFAVAMDSASKQNLFLLAFALVSYYFASQMNRLMILCSPAVASLAGIVVGRMVSWVFAESCTLAKGGDNACEDGDESSTSEEVEGTRLNYLATVVRNQMRLYKENNQTTKLATVGLAAAIMSQSAFLYQGHCRRAAVGLSQPTIISTVYNKETDDFDIKDDYRLAYSWLKNHTPADTRVLAWWDYGYHINAIANRTTIADGNTWNHDHIATLGLCLTSPEQEAHDIIRHLAEYVLVWTGPDREDIQKASHIARIANSVYGGICGSDFACSGFRARGLDADTGALRASLVWSLTHHGKEYGADVDPRFFEEAYVSKNDLVRIFRVVNISQESKSWSANPDNRLCDAPGSWHCPGQYPPALNSLINRRREIKRS